MAQAQRDAIERLRVRIEQSDELESADAEALIEFSDELYMLSTEYSDHRHEKLLRHCTRMAERVGGLAAALEDRDAAEKLVRWINRTYENEETNRDYRVALRVFGRRATDAGADGPDSPPGTLDWIPSGTSSTYDPAPEPAKMLRWEEDVLPMIEATFNSRDAAAIALQFDAGLRGGEFKQLTVGDLTDHKYGLQVTVEGKQGKRTVTLIPSVPYVRRWLDDHPAADNPSAPLWSKITKAEGLSDQMVLKIFREAAGRAWDVDIDEHGIDALPKPVTLTNFRKSSATHLASKGMSQAHIEDHHGWVRGSSVATRYVSVFSGDSDRALAEVYGMDVPDEDGEDHEIAPVVCPRCEKETPREKDLCVWCGQAIEPGAAEVADSIESELLASIKEDDLTPEQVETRVNLLERFRSTPEERADLVDKFAGELEG